MEALFQTETNLEYIYEEFKQLRVEYVHDPYKGSGDSAELDRLLNYADSFAELYAQIRPICAEVYEQRTRHDDKACTAFKGRVAYKIHDDNKKISLNKAEQLATGSEEYEKFLEDRIYHYKSWESIKHLRDSIHQYIINVGQRISQFK
jgi:hypothetical protein